MDVAKTLMELLSIESTPEKGTNEIAKEIARILEENGFEVELEGSREKNILARKGNPNIAVLSHMDTVPIGDGWTKNPLGEIKGNKIFGRGACDVKGGLSAMLTAGIESKNAFLIFTFGEELGLLGAKRLDPNKIPDEIVVTEPTSLKIINRHKGALAIRITVRGKSAHASHPERGINAIEKMMEIWSDLKTRMEKIGTCNIGVIKGGTKPNVVPDFCESLIDVRFSSIRDREKIMELLSGFEAEIPVDLPPLNESPEFAAKISRIIGAPITSLDGCTEAGILSLMGKKAVVFGPGDISLAHAPDEFISIDELERAVEMFKKLDQAP